MTRLELLIKIVEVNDCFVVARLHDLVLTLLKEEEVEDGVALVCEHGLSKRVIKANIIIILEWLCVFAEVHEREVLSGDV